MALYPRPDLSERTRAGLVLAAAIAGAFGVIVSVLRDDWFAAALIAIVIALLVLVWAWTRREHSEE